MMRKLVSSAWVWAGAAVILLVAGLARAAQKRPELANDAAVRKYLADRAAELERDLLPGIRTGAAFEKVRPGLRAEYLDMLGLHPLPERTALKAVTTGRIEKAGYSVEKLHFQSRPGL